MKTREEVRSEINQMYNYCKPIIDKLVEDKAGEVNRIIKDIRAKMGTLTTSELENYILSLSIEASIFSDDKDMAKVREDCSTMLMKERQAQIFVESDGTQIAKQTQSIIDTKEEQVWNLILGAVSARLKTKLDEAHRVVDSIKSVLISRQSENKWKGVPNRNGNSTEDIYRDDD